MSESCVGADLLDCLTLLLTPEPHVFPILVVLKPENWAEDNTV